MSTRRQWGRPGEAAGWAFAREGDAAGGAAAVAGADAGGAWGRPPGGGNGAGDALDAFVRPLRGGEGEEGVPRDDAEGAPGWADRYGYVGSSTLVEAQEALQQEARRASASRGGCRPEAVVDGGRPPWVDAEVGPSRGTELRIQNVRDRILRMRRSVEEAEIEAPPELIDALSSLQDVEAHQALAGSRPGHEHPAAEAPARRPRMKTTMDEFGEFEVGLAATETVPGLTSGARRANRGNEPGRPDGDRQ